MSRLFQALLVLSLLVAAGFPSAADEARREQDEARSAVESGAILPLEVILAKLRQRLPGEVVKVKLEREGGAWIYEFRLVDSRGHLREISVDAATGALKDAGDD
jgi:uncharacterized membrane protein YkoI